MRKTTELNMQNYPSHYILRNYRDMIQEHVNLEQEETPSDYVTNWRMNKVERMRYFRNLGNQYTLWKKQLNY